MSLQLRSRFPKNPTWTGENWAAKTLRNLQSQLQTVCPENTAKRRCLKGTAERRESRRRWTRNGKRNKKSWKRSIKRTWKKSWTKRKEVVGHHRVNGRAVWGMGWVLGSGLANNCVCFATCLPRNWLVRCPCSLIIMGSWRQTVSRTTSTKSSCRPTLRNQLNSRDCRASLKTCEKTLGASCRSTRWA